MKIIIAPDSFKGSLSAREVGLAIKKAFKSEIPGAQIEVIPMADGGEGTLETLLFATKGKEIVVDATGPLGERRSTAYGVLGDGKTAVIEMAQVAGLPIIPPGKRNPMLTTTYGVGELISHALDQGYRHFIIGLGGSATNDGGLGMLQALGVGFFDASGSPVKPIGASLKEIKTIDFHTLDARIRQCELTVASDVENPLCGPQGASFIFGPQKGATTEQVNQLDEGLKHYSGLIEQELNQVWQHQPGAGAAGGLGFALLALGARIVSGAKVVADATGLKSHIESADWVITGEGQSDGQTLYGKVPSFVAKLANEYGVHSVLLSGGLGDGFEQLYSLFVSCHSIVPGPVTLEQAMENAEEYLIQAARNIARLVSRQKSSNRLVEPLGLT